LNKDEKDEIQEYLKCFCGAITGYDFEQILKVVLEKMGFEEIEVTSKSRDGGVDLKCIRSGVDFLTKLDEVKYVIQAKKFAPQKTIPIKEIRALRGVMTSGQKGMFVTTGKFSNDAESFAKEDDSKPIILIDGSTLMKICIKYRIGFILKPIFDESSLTGLLSVKKEEIEKFEKLGKDINSYLKKDISKNDIRSKILPIPNSILSQIPESYESYKVLFEDGEQKDLKINRIRKYFGGITSVFRQFGLIDASGNFKSKSSFWKLNKKDEFIEVLFRDKYDG